MDAPMVQHFGYMADMRGELGGTQQKIVVLAAFEAFPESFDLVHEVFPDDDDMAHIVTGQ